MSTIVPIEKVKVFAPASVANLACGYDVLGLALPNPGDEIAAELNDSGKITIKEIIGDAGKLPLDPAINSATVAAQGVWNHFKNQIQSQNLGAKFTIYKKMPFGSGLGSSAASAVAGAFAANELLGSPLSKKELLPFAMLGETAADGSYHADNVAASLFGGIILCRSNQSLDIINLPVPKNLAITVIHPQLELLTKQAREILPKTIELQQASKQLGHIAGFISALYEENFDLLKRSLKDEWISKHRSKLIPQFEELKEAALELGALGFNISGAGPSVFALCQNLNEAKLVEKKLLNIWNKQNLQPKAYTSLINTQGTFNLNKGLDKIRGFK